MFFRIFDLRRSIFVAATLACSFAVLGPCQLALGVELALGNDLQDSVGESHSDPISENTLKSDAVPAWVHRAVFYQIFPERFENGDPANDPTRESLEGPSHVPDSWCITPWTQNWYRRQPWEVALGDDFFRDGVFHRRYGGDLQGIIDRLDYLKTLGISAIYLNPVFYSHSLHKYNGDSFHHVDPYFGPDPQGDLEIIRTESLEPSAWKMTSADKLFLKLIDEVHLRNMRLVLDGVFNHTGCDFPAFADIRERQQDSPYLGWYSVKQFDDPQTPANEFRYQSWWGIDSLPEFANNAAGDDLASGPKAYIFAATKRWMDPDGDGNPDDGIDGWRLDVAEEVPPGFWKQWNRFVRDLNPDCYTVAENWNDASSYLEECEFSATMNYFGFAAPVKGFFIDGRLSASDFVKVLNSRRESHDLARRYAMLNLVDSHDTARVASMIVNPDLAGDYQRPDRWDYDVNSGRGPDYSIKKPTDDQRRIQRMIALFQMVYVGVPQIYYGTESGMWGADDPSNRMPMVWEDREYEPQVSDVWVSDGEPEKVAADKDLYMFFRYACRMRRYLPALQEGDYEAVTASDESQAFAIRRQDKNHTVYAIFNRGDEPYEWVFETSRDRPLMEVFTASGWFQQVEIVGEGNKVKATIPAREGVVLMQPRQ